MIAWLSGKKTYVLVILAAFVMAVQGLKAAGLPAFQGIPDGAFNWLLAILGTGGVATLRAAVQKAVKK